jgi:hypothetical protein
MSASVVKRDDMRRICVDTETDHVAYSGELIITKTNPIRIRVVLAAKRFATSCAVLLGDGGGKKPARMTNPMIQQTARPATLHAAHFSIRGWTTESMSASFVTDQDPG